MNTRLSCFVILLVAVAIGKEIRSFQFRPNEPVVSERFVKHINQHASSWTASTKQSSTVKGLTFEQAKILTGALKGGPKLPRRSIEPMQNLPTTFDSRTNWPDCVSMKQIRDQSACGSCWAFGAVEAISDRYCVFMKQNITVSAEDMTACCDSCGFGCGGGYPSAAWQYWVSTGLVTEQCSPYSLPSCDHHIPNSPHPCPTNEYPTPNCTQSCQNGKNWNSDLHFGANAYTIDGGEQAMMTEIFQNGPVESAFTVYSDFLTYKSGVYQYTSGDELGGHAIKILGWGVEDNLPYWLVANSWNPDWGDHGYFKILRGQDECGIEDEANGGTPQN